MCSEIIGLVFAVLVGVVAAEYAVVGVPGWDGSVVPEPDAVGWSERDGSEECVAECLPGNLLDQNPSPLLVVTMPSRLLV